MNDSQIAVPQYRCHKKVWAARITDITSNERESAGAPDTSTLKFGEISGYRIVTDEWLTNRKAEVGGYWIQYEDGYESYSPATAFESGYSRI